MKKKKRSEKDILLSLSFTKSKEWKPVFKRAFELLDQKYDAEIKHYKEILESKNLSFEKLGGKLDKDYVKLVIKIRADYIFISKYLDEHYSDENGKRSIKIIPSEFYTDSRIKMLIEDDFLSARMNLIRDILKWKNKYPGGKAKGRKQDLIYMEIENCSDNKKEPWKDKRAILIVAKKNFPNLDRDELIKKANDLRVGLHNKIKKANSY